MILPDERGHRWARNIKHCLDCGACHHDAGAQCILTEWQARGLALREAGETYRAIGQEWAVSTEQARQRVIVARAKRAAGCA